jgi:predicted nucleic acid-binding protein
VSKDQLLSDYEEARNNFRQKYAWYTERVERKMRIYELDTQDVQSAWNVYARLRKQLGAKLEED